jgi:hypothetical protein
MGGDLARAAGALIAIAAFVLVVTRVDAGGPDRASVRVVSATGAARATDSVGADAVVRANAIEPGDQAVGAVTVANDGDATGAIRMTQSDVLDAPGPGGARLSTMLGLRIDEARTGRPVYRGVLGAMDDRRLGYLRAGEERTYRFTLRFPPRAPREPYARAQVEATFDWTATTGEPPAPGSRPDSAPPRVVVQTLRQDPADGAVRVALTCDERCAIVGVSGGAPAPPRRWQQPGRPAVHVLRGAAAPLRVIVADEAGNRVATPSPR